MKDPVQVGQVQLPVIVLPASLAVNGNARVPFAPATVNVHVPVSASAAIASAASGAAPVVKDARLQEGISRSSRPVTVAELENVVPVVFTATVRLPLLLN